MPHRSRAGSLRGPCDGTLARVALAVVAAIAAVAPRAFAQGEPKKPVAPPAPPPVARPAPARVAPTFESLQVTADELPEGWSLSKQIRTVSPQPATLLEDDLYSPILPKPHHRDFQTIVGKTTTGSILYFDWGEKIPDAVEEFVPALLFGEKKEQSTKLHPELIVRHGGLMVILSFPLDSAERGWAIDRFRKRFGLRFGINMDPALRPIFAKLKAAVDDGGDAKAGLAYAEKHTAEIARSSFASFLEGELATGLQDWERARKAYAQALELDATTDPFPDDGVAWASRDGLGTAFWGLKKYDDAIRELTLAAKEAADLERPEDQGHCLYNLACSQALKGLGDEALATLKQSLALDPSQKEHASKDDDFASIRARPEFQALVK
jgi:hypothetical protein